MGDSEVIEDSAYAAAAQDLLSAEQSLSVKEKERQQLEEQIEMFLKQGGTINEIPPNVVADPPKKPQSNYGGQPI